MGNVSGVARLLALALVCLLVVGALPASAQEPPVGLTLSRDGSTWVATIDERLFSPELGWSPGELRTSSLWVRNDGTTTSDVDVVLERTGAGTSAAQRYLTLAARVGDGQWASLSADGEQRVPVTGLAPRATVEVVLRAELAQTTPVDVTVDPADLEFRVSLASPEASVTAPSGSTGDESGSANLELIPLFLVCALLLAGFAAWSTRRARSVRRLGGPRPGAPSGPGADA